MPCGARTLGLVERLVYATLPVLLSVVFSAHHLVAVLGGELRNPDSYMRLTRLIATLRQGTPMHEIMRDASGDGAVVHWSHLIDGVLCALSLPLQIFLAPADALHLAALIFGPLNLGILGVAVAWAAAPFSDRRWLWLAPLTIALAPAILPYGLVGVVHHHVPSVTIAVMTGGLAVRVIAGIANAHAGRALGIWAGIGIWLTPETLPLSMLAFGALWLVWVWQDGARAAATAIADTSKAFAVTVTTAWLVNPPFGGHLTQDIDRVSIVFVGLALAIAAIGRIILVLDERALPRSSRLIWSMTGGIGCAVVWACLFAQTLFAVHAAMDDALAHAMFQNINEMAPVRSLNQWFNYLLTGCLAVATLIALTLRSRIAVMFYLTLCGLVLIALGQMHLRFASYPEALGAIMVPIAVSWWAQAVIGWPAWRQPLPRVATIVLFVLVPFVAELSQPGKTATAGEPRLDSACPVHGLAPMLAPYTGQVVLTDVNKAPELLYRTQILTVGSLYHRNQTGFSRLYAAWRSMETQDVPPSFTDARIGFVLFCRMPGRSAMVKDLPATTLLDRLGRGEIPAWLVPVAEDQASGHTLYRVGS